MIKYLKFRDKLREIHIEPEYNNLKLRIRGSEARPYVWVVHGYKNRNRIEESLARMMLKPAQGFHVDHINGNSLDNRLQNLRIVTPKQNMRNQSVTERRLPRGVFKHKKKLKAQITVNMKTIHLGTFDCPAMAHLVYLNARENYYGKQFRNFPAKRSEDK
jgi:hypothetical protein